MAKKYIDADEVYEHLVKNAIRDSQPRAIRRAATMVLDFPAADVAPVRHGRWLDYDDTERFTARCNLCNNVIDTRFGRHFCPKCGADMREEEADNEA